LIWIGGETFEPQIRESIWQIAEGTRKEQPGRKAGRKKGRKPTIRHISRECTRWSQLPHVTPPRIGKIWIYVSMGRQAGLEFLTSYVVEKSLSIDNIFVFLLIFKGMTVPAAAQHKVPYYGVDLSQTANTSAKRGAICPERLGEGHAASFDLILKVSASAEPITSPTKARLDQNG
jgi:hypothetical protein